jgi:hypothetical protein
MLCKCICILAEMLNANQLFGEAVKQVYEPDWSGREKFVQLLDVSVRLQIGSLRCRQRTTGAENG